MSERFSLPERHDLDDPSQGRIARSTRSLRMGILGILAGIGAALIGAVVLLMATSDRQPLLNQADYEAAAERWDRFGPTSYNLDLELKGKRPSTIRVEVRDGEITKMLRDGYQPSQRRTWYYWSVPGQFDTIAQELEMAKDPAKAYGAPGASQVVLWGQFNEQYGYPEHFQRSVLGTDLEVEWTTTRFEPLPATPNQ